MELKEREPTHRMQPPQWMTSFKMLRYSLKSADSRNAFDLIYELIKDETTLYRIFRLIGLAQGFFVVLEYFAGFNVRRGLKWSKIHSDEIVETLLKEIQASKRKTLE